MNFHRERFPDSPVFDTAMSHAMLRRVAAGSATESLRLYVPDNALLFSSLDARRPGFGRAAEIAASAGFPPVIRLAGGQAAAFLDDSVAFAWAIPDRDAHLHIQQRFEALSGWIVSALRRIGLDARVGPVPGEYCPGDYSVNIAGRVKIMGVGQRVIRGGAHVGGVLTVGGTQVLREVLGPVYECLGFDFQPETAGGVADFDPNLRAEDVLRALCDELAEHGRELVPIEFDESTRRDAEALIPIHEPGTHGGHGHLLRASDRNAKALVQEHGSDSSRERSGVDDS